jgi:hypothetical protein
MSSEEKPKDEVKIKSVGLSVEEYNALLSYKLNNNIKTMGDAIMA